MKINKKHLGFLASYGTDAQKEHIWYHAKDESDNEGMTPRDRITDMMGAIPHCLFDAIANTGEAYHTGCLLRHPDISSQHISAIVRRHPWQFIDAARLSPDKIQPEHIEEYLKKRSPQKSFIDTSMLGAVMRRLEPEIHEKFKQLDPDYYQETSKYINMPR